MSVSDGATSTDTVEAIMHFNANPVLINNILRVSAGQTVILTSSDLSATGGLDNDPNTVVFTVSDLQNGSFALISNRNIPITSFTQQQVNDRQVQFVHAGGENAPSYKISVSNGVVTIPPSFATVSFELSNPTHTSSSSERSNDNPCDIACIIGVTTGLIGTVATVAGTYIAYRHKRSNDGSTVHPREKPRV